MPVGLDIFNRILPANPNYGVQEDASWRTLSSKMDSGTILTRSKSIRPTRSWTILFSKFTKPQKDAILNFYHTQQGGYGKFLFMPYKEASADYIAYGDGFSDITGTTGGSSSGTTVYLEKYMPAVDDLYNNWTIEIGAEHRIITDYDGSNKKLTVSSAFTSPANKTYILHQLIGYTSGGATTLNLIKNYGNHSETKKYVYREGTGTYPTNIYEPRIWRHTGSGAPVLETPAFTTDNNFLDGDRNYSESPITGLTTARYYTGSWYYLYPVRFHPEESFSDLVFNTNLFDLNMLRLQEVIEP